ncbi:MAG TPA: spore cortex biosynthesis protein YabQ [Candidatus Scybalomonas excrementigallinarum]|nr:spore cortex biosynthesis protein YabQ [Candidatus Scybalomonas excrementigallinarum]
MNLSLLKEAHLFYLSILYGGMILFFYDWFRIVRRLIPHHNIMIAIEDLIFWIITGFSIFALIYQYNNGSIRAYCILGMGMGMIFYGMAVSPFFVRLALKIGNFFKKILRKCKKGLIIVHRKRRQKWKGKKV